MVMKMKRTNNFDLFWKLNDSKRFNKGLAVVDQWANNSTDTNAELTVKEIVTSRAPDLYDKLSPQDKKLLGRAVSNRYSIKYYNRVVRTGKKGASKTYRKF